MDRSTAKQLTIEQHEIDSNRNPFKNDFSYTIIKDGVNWKVIWSRDINVKNPVWHISVEEKR